MSARFRPTALRPLSSAVTSTARRGAAATLVLLILATVVPVLTPAVAAAQACTISWDGQAGTTDWHHAANWDLDRLPNSTDVACISGAVAGNDGVTVSAATPTHVAALQSDTWLRTSTGAQLELLGDSYALGLEMDGGVVTVHTLLDLWDMDQNDGLVDGDGTLRVSGFLRWEGGEQWGPGRTEVYEDGGHGGLRMTQDTTRRALGRAIDDHAGTEITAGTLELAGQDSVLTLTAPSGTVGGTGRITGTGTVHADGQLIVGEGGSLDVESRLDTGPTAAVQVLGDGSRLAVYGGGTHQGDVLVKAGASFELRGGQHTFEQGSTITTQDTGEVQVAHEATDATVLGSYQATTTTVLAGTIRLPAGADLGDVEILGGKLEVTGDVAADSVVHDEGTVGGTGTLAVEGDYTWGRGTQAGEGVTEVGGQLDLAGPDRTRTIDSRWVSAEALVWQESGTVAMTGEDPTLTAGTTHVEGVQAGVTGAGGTFLPGDTVVTGDAVLVVTAAFESQAGETLTLDGEGAFLDLQGGGSHAGTIDDGATASGGMNLGGTHVFLPPSQITLGGSSIGIYEGADVTFGGAQTVSTEINSSGSVTVDSLVNIGAYVNHGFVTVNDGKLLWLDAYTQPSEDGWTELAGPTAEISIEGAGSVSLHGGLLEGSGKVDGNLVNDAGYVSPTGELEVTGNYTQGAAGTLGVETEGDTVDRLTVSGAATLDGSLEVLLGGPTSQPLEVLAAAVVNGQFATVTGSGDCWDLVYDATGVYLWPQPCISIPAASGVEDLGTVSFPVTLSQPYDADVTVSYATQNGTASAGTDFTAASGTLTIPAGQTEGVIQVALVADDEVEDEESFGLAVSAEGGRLSVTSVDGFIVDDDEEDEETELEYSTSSIPTIGVYSTPTAMSDQYAVGYTTLDYHGANDYAYYYNVDTGAFAYWGDVIYAWDINEARQLVGDCGENLWTTPCFRSQLTNHDVARPGSGSPSVNGLNDWGELVGTVATSAGPGPTTYQAVLWESYDQAPRTIVENASAIDINDNGVVVGIGHTAGTENTAWVWSESTGRVDIPALPGHSHMRAEAINSRGTVVGYALADGDPTPHAWAWHPTTGTVDLGPGVARDINRQGDVVGWGYDPGSATWGAVLWRDGEAHDLNDHIQPFGLRLAEAATINDRGHIQVFALGGEWVGVLSPPQAQAPADVTVEVELEEQQYPTGQWTDAGGRVIEGNSIRVTATLTNDDDEEHTVGLELLDPDEESLLDEESTEVTLAPGESKDIVAEWDTTGRAWSGQNPRAEAQFVSAILWQGIDARRTQVGIEVNPRPVVLVHGLWSDASTWDAYPQMLAAKHPGWRGYAIPTMDTQSFVPNLVSENANLLDTYIRQVQEAENAWQIDLVGHSMGGLISRFYIQEYMTTLQGENAVANLVMLGTPNAGSPCADLAVVPATYELRPDVVAQFNEAVTDRKGVPFSVAAGIHVPVTCHAPLPGDDVVPVESAQHGIEDTLLFEIAHTSMTGSQLLFDQWVVPHLTAPAGAAVTTTVAPDAVLSDSPAPAARPTAAAAAAAADAQLVLADVVELGDGEDTSYYVDVPEGVTGLGAMAMGPGTVEVRIVRGDRETTSTAGDDPNMGFRTAHLADPEAGEWYVVVTNAGDEPVEVPVSVWIEGSDERLTVLAEQVGTTGRVQVTAAITGRTFTQPPSVWATVIDPDSGAESLVELFDDGAHGDGEDGDLVYGGVAKGLTSGGHLVVARTGSSTFDRVATTTVQVEVEGDTPANDPPVALPMQHTANRNTAEWLVLEGDDPDADELEFEIVTPPAHGLATQAATGTAQVRYRPTTGYMGPDSFTFRVGDGEHWSAPATVTIEVIGSATSFTYFAPFPSEAPQGTKLVVTAFLRDAQNETPDKVPVTFTWNGQTYQSSTSNGLASLELDLLHVEPGQYELGFSFAGTAELLPSSGSRTITVKASKPPAPSFPDPIVGEAGYPVVIGVRANDPDNNGVLYEFDFDDDGTFDEAITSPSLYNTLTTVEHTYPEAFEGTVRARVTDNTGLVGETTTTVDIAPHRPLGALRRLLVDGVRVGSVDLSADGSTILYEVTDNEEQHQLATPYGVYDRVTGEHELASIRPDGTPSHDPGSGAISADGRFVIWSDWQTPTTFRLQAWLRDTETDTTTMVGLNDADQPASLGVIPVDVSADGRYVLLHTSATNMTEQDIMSCGTNGSQPCEQLYLRDVLEGTTTLVSVGPDGVARGGHYWADLSDDGRLVSFVSRGEILVWDRETGESEIVEVTTDGQKPGGETNHPTLSADGHLLTFSSAGSNVVAGDTNGASDVFQHDRRTGLTTRVSVDSAEAQADDTSSFAAPSCDGSLVVFWSYATDLVDGDTNDRTDVFLRDLSNGTTRRISVEARDQLQGNSDSQLFPRISADGRWIIFESEASNLVPGDTNGHARDTFLLDTGVSRPCGEGPANEPPAVSVDGPTTLVEGGQVELTASATDADGDDVTLSWVTDAGDLAIEDGAEVATLAVDDGPEEVHVTVTASDGTVQVTGTLTVTVTNAPPAAGAGADAEVPAGQDLAFAGSATDPSEADTAAGFTFAWDLGDGTSVDGPILEHAYEEAGTYTATLTVTDKDGAQATDSRTVTVLPDEEEEPESTVPGPPVDVSAIGGDTNANVQWDPPLDDGGSPITGYEVKVTPGGATHEVGVQESLLVGGLTNGVEHTFAVRARNANGYGPYSAASNVAVPRPSCSEDAFVDVPDDHPFCPEIDWMADNGIALGWTDGTYRPRQDVSRAGLIAFAYRLAGSPRGTTPACTEVPFSDVPVDHPFCGEIAWAKEAGVTTGYADGSFRSRAAVSRAEMTAFLYRLTDSPRGADPGCSQDEFPDVPAAHGMCGEIDWAVDSGLVGGYGDGSFRPSAPISRQAMAAIILRYDVLTGIVGG